MQITLPLAIVTVMMMMMMRVMMEALASRGWMTFLVQTQTVESQPRSQLPGNLGFYEIVYIYNLVKSI